MVAASLLQPKLRVGGASCAAALVEVEAMGAAEEQPLPMYVTVMVAGAVKFSGCGAPAVELHEAVRAAVA